MSIFKKINTGPRIANIQQTTDTSANLVEDSVVESLQQAIESELEESINPDILRDAVSRGLETASVSGNNGGPASSNGQQGGGLIGQNVGFAGETIRDDREIPFVQGISTENIASFVAENCDVDLNNTQDLANQFQNDQITAGTIATIVTDITPPEPERVDSAGVKIDNFLRPPGADREARQETENIDIALNNPIDTVFDPRGIITDNIPSEIEEQLTISAGKKEFYVLQDLIGPAFQTFITSNPISDNQVFTKDSFRGRLGAYWSLGESFKNLLFLRKDKKVENKSFFKATRFNVFNKLFDELDPTTIGFIEENITVNFKSDYFSINTSRQNTGVSKKLIDALSFGGVFQGATSYDNKVDFEYSPTFRLSTPFYDFVYTRYLPYTRKELENTQLPISSTTAEIKMDYNFYIKSYESLLSTTEVPENLLPNFYLILSEQKSEIKNPDYNKLITLNGNINSKISSAIRATTSRSAPGVLRGPASFLPGPRPVGRRSISTQTEEYDVRKSAGQYYDLYAQAYKKLNNSTIDSLSLKTSNLVISKNDLDLIKSFADKKELFPMNIDISFSTDKTTKFCGILSETNLTDVFVTKIINKIIEEKYSNFDFIKETTNDNKTTNFSEETKRGWNILEILAEIEDIGRFEELNPNTAIYLGEYENYRKSLNTEQNKFINSLNMAIFKNKLISFAENNMRTYNDIINGKKAYSETILYRIAKYVGDSAFGEPIQNVYIPNDPDLDILRYIDTQVKYDQKYTYIVYSYEFVLGSEYSYESVRDLSTRNSTKVLNVRTKPYMTVLESEFYRKTISILDKPPSQPELTVSSYKDVNNKLLFMLNSSVNEHLAQPIPINDNDIEMFEKIRISQELDEDEYLRFGGDDRIREFEIYRLSRKPSSYEDFKNNLLLTLSTDYSAASIQQANSAAFVDTLEPNRKYYYTFRSIDIHGNISNPSELLEVEIISESGTTFALVKNVDFSMPDIKDPSRTFKRFIQLMPNIAQSIVDESSYPAEATSAEQVKNAIKLGIVDQKIWGKKVKLRLVSKNTKKVLDFTVKFDHKNYDIVEK